MSRGFEKFFFVVLGRSACRSWRPWLLSPSERLYCIILWRSCQGVLEIFFQVCGAWTRTTFTPLSDYPPKEPHERGEQSRTVLGLAGRYHPTWAPSLLEHLYSNIDSGFCQAFFKKFFRFFAILKLDVSNSRAGWRVRYD